MPRESNTLLNIEPEAEVRLSHHEIREKFLNFFVENGHQKIDNSSLIPENDPTLLLVNSGMAPLKKLFTGEEKPQSVRLTNIQRCIRTNDIESVGDNSHLTFFEMMGNWSIGDYFKPEALRFAWQLLTERYDFDPNRLHVSVYGGDEQYLEIPPDVDAFQIWQQLGIPVDRIHTMGAEDNFWGPAGITGPCGPASEVYYDLGEDKGCQEQECNPSHTCGRFLEIWNPGVFMEYSKDEDGNFSRLPFPSVDAGAGIERFAYILQGVDSVYDTDLLKPIMEAVLQENNIHPMNTDEFKKSSRIITDHLRSSVFMIADGILPANKGKEYVLRRLIRRMVVNNLLLGSGNMQVGDSVNYIISEFGQYYPHLINQEEMITGTLNGEINRFSKTLSRSMREVEKLLKRSSQIIPGYEAFRLYDSYGLPFEILESIVTPRGFAIEKESFDDSLKLHKKESRR